MRIALALIAVATVAACASGPVQQASSPNPSQAVSAPVKAAAPVAATAAPSAAEPIAATDGEFSAPAGYQKRNRGGTTVYCKSETPIGTRFANEYCYTQADLERMEASRVNLKQEVDRTRRTCTGGGCGGG
jgi:hypothetical protein